MITQFNTNQDEKLIKEFKKKCIDRGLEINEGVSQALKSWLKGGQKK